MRFALKAMLAFCLVCVLAFSGLDVYLIHRERERIGPDMAFNARVWKSAELDSTSTTRLRMEKDLLRRHHLVGMTRQQVMNLLGPASDPAPSPNGSMIYWLGPEGGLFPGIDSVGLELKMRDGKVVAVGEFAG